MSNRPKHYVTKDGSSTFYSTKFEQYYHNPNGSVSESKYIFFEASGLDKALQFENEISIFEVGFGTGLNLLLLLDYYRKAKRKQKVVFYSVEAFPLSFTEAKQLDFGEFADEKDQIDRLASIFKNLQPGLNIIRPWPDVNIELQLYFGLFSDCIFDALNVDFIFQDAFSPDVNQELWTVDTFLKLASFSSESTVLTTYCASSKARASMAMAGWKLAKRRGALGKREMTVASLSTHKLDGLKKINEERLKERYKDGDFST